MTDGWVRMADVSPLRELWAVRAILDQAETELDERTLRQVLGMVRAVADQRFKALEQAWTS